MGKISKKWRELYRREPEKWQFWTLVILFLGSMLPVWYLSRYTVMGCDDYYYGNATHQAWLATHSLGEVLRVALETTADYWHKWQGTYASIFLMTLAPGIFGERLYFLTVFLMTGMLILGISTLGHVFLKEYAGCQSPWRRGSCIFVLLFVSVQTMVSPADGIFWYNGALHYVFMQSLLYLTIAALLAFRVCKRRGRRFCLLVLGAVGGFACGGANLLTALQAVVVSAGLAALDVCWTKKKDNRWLTVPFLVTLAGFLLNVLAPGNGIRETTAAGMGALQAVFLSFYWALVYLAEWTTPFVLAGFLFLLPTVLAGVGGTKRRFWHPLWAALVSYCIYAAMFTPTLYAMSSDGPDRCKNIVRITLYLLLFANLVNWAGYREQKRRAGSIYALTADYLRERGTSWRAVCLGLFLFLFLFVADKNTYTSVSALRSLVNGEAAGYYRENWERLALYNDDTQKEVTVRPLQARPHLLYKADVGNEGSDGYWVTIAVKQYYHKEKVTVEETPDGSRD